MSTEFHFILPDSGVRSVALVLNADGTYSLPKFNQGSEVRYNTVTGINDALRKAWNVTTTVSRCLLEGDQTTPAIFAMHNHDADWHPKANEAAWHGLEQISQLNFANPEHRKHLLEWIESLSDETWIHVPWSAPEWNERASNWISESVRNIGAEVLSGPEQVRAWAISAVIKVETDQGIFYFKAVPDFFGHAPILEKYLSEHFPENFIDITAIEPNQHWMLSKEWVGENPRSSEEWRHILQVVADIQMHCKDNVDELLSFGCKDRRLSKLPDLVLPIFEELKDPGMLEMYGINMEEANELRRRLELFPELCARLNKHGLPETLIHGDLWGNNIIYRDKLSGKSPVIFDWTDASIAHPFIDIYLLLTSEPDLSKRPMLRQIFVDVWSERFPQTTVVAALEAAELVAPFYFMYAFRNVQLNAPKASRWELAFLFKRFVRNILLLPELVS
ncbi:MAG: phosphotransferase [Candidatus Obscuribacterales bacterium]|nr:phosphotransferase [Candidatus Obscuribacterales bacterium]